MQRRKAQGAMRHGGGEACREASGPGHATARRHGSLDNAYSRDYNRSLSGAGFPLWASGHCRLRQGWGGYGRAIWQIIFESRSGGPIRRHKRIQGSKLV